jgi:hypothetical protein
MIRANLWSQLFQQRTSLPPSETGFRSQRVVAGKVQAPAKTNRERKRARYSKVAIRQLEDALISSAKELEELWARGALTIKVANLTEGMFQAACSTLDATLQHNRKGAPPMLRGAKALLKQAENFRADIDSHLTHDRPHALALACCLHKFCCDITDYEQQIRFAYAIVDLSPGGKPKLPHRPTDWAAKIAFAEIVFSHQVSYGVDTFPKTKTTEVHLKNAGHSVSPRTLRWWRQQMDAGTFSSHVQQRKRQ